MTEHHFIAIQRMCDRTLPAMQLPEFVKTNWILKELIKLFWIDPECLANKTFPIWIRLKIVLNGSILSDAFLNFEIQTRFTRFCKIMVDVPAVFYILNAQMISPKKILNGKRFVGLSVDKNCEKIGKQRYLEAFWLE